MVLGLFTVFTRRILDPQIVLSYGLDFSMYIPIPELYSFISAAFSYSVPA